MWDIRGLAEPRQGGNTDGPKGMNMVLGFNGKGKGADGGMDLQPLQLLRGYWEALRCGSTQIGRAHV